MKNNGLNFSICPQNYPYFIAGFLWTVVKPKSNAQNKSPLTSSQDESAIVINIRHQCHIHSVLGSEMDQLVEGKVSNNIEPLLQSLPLFPFLFPSLLALTLAYRDI